jgi:hypothetical protein
VAKAQAVLSEPELLRAMFDVGYFPPNTPPFIHVTVARAQIRSRAKLDGGADLSLLEMVD